MCYHSSPLNSIVRLNVFWGLPSIRRALSIPGINQMFDDQEWTMIDIICIHQYQVYFHFSAIKSSQSRWSAVEWAHMIISGE